MQYQDGTGFNITAKRLIVDWEQDSVTWNNLFGPGDTVRVTNRQSTEFVDDDDVYWDLTEIVEYWEGGSTNYGVILEAESSVENTHALRDRAFKGDRFRLSVTYSLETTSPTISITNPSENITLPHGTSSVELQGSAYDSYLEEVTYQNVSTGDSGIASGKFSWSCIVPLQLGNNLITVIAKDESGNTDSKTIEVFIEHPQLTVLNGSGSGKYPSASLVPISAEPAELGQIFRQWEGDTDFVEVDGVYSASTFVIMPNQNITLSATYENCYNLIVNNGTGSGFAYTNGQQVLISADTPPSGKLFDSWIGDTQHIASVTSNNTIVTVPDHDITVTATYRDIMYTISYNANNATSGTAPDSQTKTYDVSLTLGANTGNLDRTGYTFGGWNTNTSGTGTAYAAGDTYTINATVTLYAKWTILPTYTVKTILQILSGQNPEYDQLIYSDVNNDDKIGMEEAIYALQNVSRASYETVTSATGRIWMDRNLGASRVATSATDVKAYGDLYQWGRIADGHEKRTSATTTGISSTNIPDHGDFILVKEPWWDNRWTTGSIDISGANNPCPTGFRLPTQEEWQAEIDSWGSNSVDGAWQSPLKLVAAGTRNYLSGALSGVGTSGYYWSSTSPSVSCTFICRYMKYLNFTDETSTSSTYSPTGSGACVRCIKVE